MFTASQGAGSGNNCFLCLAYVGGLDLVNGPPFENPWHMQHKLFGCMVSNFTILLVYHWLLLTMTILDPVQHYSGLHNSMSDKHGRQLSDKTLLVHNWDLLQQIKTKILRNINRLVRKMKMFIKAFLQLKIHLTRGYLHWSMSLLNIQGGSKEVSTCHTGWIKRSSYFSLEVIQIWQQSVIHIKIDEISETKELELHSDNGIGHKKAWTFEKYKPFLDHTVWIQTSFLGLLSVSL